jgi:capsular exopolysaccharide synthesis family protein
VSLEQYVTIIIKHWKLIFICFVLVGVGAYIGSKLMIPYYQSTALVEIAIRSGVNQVDYTSLLASDQLVQTEAILATSDPVLREVASHYSGLPVEQLSREVTASSRPNTQLFEIDVQDPSPARAAALANDVATTLIKQQDEQLQQNSIQSDVFLLLVQSAQPNPNAVRPYTLINTGAGLMAGLLLGMLLAVLFEVLDVRVRTLEELTRLLGWPVLATIWRASSNEGVVNPTGRNANIEAFRILRTNIGFSAIDKPLHTLVVTSAEPRDGKSVVAANLAVFMARAGKNTLLIDADLRRPTQHELFGIPVDKMGLSNAILAMSMSTTAHLSAYHQVSSAATPVLSSAVPGSSKSSLDPFIYAADIPNLCVMPSGPLPPNPSELFDSKAMQRFFAELAICGAEIVIFDSPPILGLSDASILASKADGALVVVDITRARKGNLKQVKDLMGQAGARVVGCIVNKQRRSRKGSIYYYYYGADERKNRRNRHRGNANPLAVLHKETPKAVKGSTASHPDAVEKDDGRDHSTNHASSPATSAVTIDTPDQQTIKLPLANKQNNKGEHRASDVNSLAALATSSDAPEEADLFEKDDGRDHSTNHASSPGAPSKTFDVSDLLTVKLSSANDASNKEGKEGRAT